MQYSPGDLVRSTAGRDKGYLYVVLELTQDRVLVVDGKRRRLIKPKPKNPLHLQLVRKNLIPVQTDDDVRQILSRMTEQSHAKEKGGN